MTFLIGFSVVVVVLVVLERATRPHPDEHDRPRWHTRNRP